ncbi:MAG: hypothetical protein WD766_09770 [Gemmatimonadota bacterium]
MTKGVSRKGEEWALERDAYVVLLHLYTVTQAAPSAALAPERITRDLGFTESNSDVILRALLYEGYVEHCGSAQGLTLTGKGSDYIERKAGRRRSLRLLS